MKSVITVKRVVTFFIVYTMLFLLVGPKFFMWEVTSLAKDGEQIRDRVYKFVAGTHKDGLIRLCFDGLINGQKNRLSFSISEEALAQKESDVLGSIPLYKSDLSEGCQNFETTNIRFASLPIGYNNKIRMLRNMEVQKFLKRLPDITYVLFYPDGYRGNIRSDTFVLQWRNGGSEHFYNFWLRGRSHNKIIVTKWGFVKAFLKDYATWPYVLFLLLSGAGSHQ